MLEWLLLLAADVPASSGTAPRPTPPPQFFEFLAEWGDDTDLLDASLPPRKTDPPATDGSNTATVPEKPATDTTKVPETDPSKTDAHGNSP